MAESEGIRELVNQAAVQAATAAMMVLRDVEAGPQLTTRASHRKPEREREIYSRPVLKSQYLTGLLRTGTWNS